MDIEQRKGAGRAYSGAGFLLNPDSRKNRATDAPVAGQDANRQCMAGSRNVLKILRQFIIHVCGRQTMAKRTYRKEDGTGRQLVSKGK